MRLLPDWVEGFVDLTEHLPSPVIFRRWAGIAAVAGALERKVWVRTIGNDLYPNLYTVLVGPPGVGKTIVTSRIEDLWRGLKDHHVAPKSLTAASLIDALAEATRKKTVISPGNTLHLEFHGLLVNSGELGVLLPQYDPAVMNLLTDIYDGRHYEERRRGKDIHHTIKKPNLNILAACTPSYLNGMLPEGAWDQGFLSRTFLVYSGERILGDIFADEQDDEAGFAKLKSDLGVISNLTGKMEFKPDVANLIREWHLSGGQPTPDHPKLTHYLTRRTMHLIKLTMIASASRTGTLTIEVRDYQRALDWLLEMETFMPDIFKALGSRGDGATIEEAWHFLYKIYMSNQRQPIQEHRLFNFLAERVPSHNVARVVEVMEKSNQIRKTIGDKGHIGYVPVIKTL